MSINDLRARVAQANKSSAIILAASPYRCGNALEFDRCSHAGAVPAFRVRECDAPAPTFFACPCRDDSLIPE